MQYEKKLAEFIRKTRIDSGVTLNSFAFKNGIDSSTLNRIETNKLELKITNLVKIAAAYGKTPSEFLADFEKISK